MHTGEAELREGDYYGTVVNRCARIRGIGHGGQVLLSEATTMLIRDHLPPRAYLLDQGEHRLKDLTRPERVFQVVADDLPREFPPLASLDIRPHNLPIHPTALLGRERETDEVRQLILQDGVRLVTLTGPGGTGKTRLSLQIAAELVDEFEDGAFVVELAPISNPALVPVTVAQVLGVRDVGGRPILESLKEYLRRRSMLLVLDNFEQILSAASVVADLMSVSPGLRVLVTSREPLHLRGEREYAVPPLALPDARHLPAPEEVARYAAVALFLERAAAIRPDFAVTDENAAAVAEICARLDGLPLAIELAAARVRLLTPQAMLTRLERRLPLLTQGAQDLPARQRTLRDTIAWSYDLLTPDEQALFRRLAIFVGGCTLESAEAAATADVGDRRWGLIVDEVLDGMDSLLSKNLLRRMPGPAIRRASRCWRRSASTAWSGSRPKASCTPCAAGTPADFLALAEQAVPRLQGSEQTAWLDRLEAEHANLRAALDWSLADDRQSDAALRLSGALAWFWAVRGYFSEGRRWLERALAESPPHPTARLAAQYGLGWMAHIHNDADVARHHLGIAIDLARQLDDRWALAWSLHVLGRVEYYANDVAASRDLGQQSLRVAREIDDPWLIAWALHLLGLSCAHRRPVSGRARLLRGGARHPAAHRLPGRDRHLFQHHGGRLLPPGRVREGARLHPRRDDRAPHGRRPLDAPQYAGTRCRRGVGARPDAPGRPHRRGRRRVRRVAGCPADPDHHGATHPRAGRRAPSVGRGRVRGRLARRVGALARRGGGRSPADRGDACGPGA